MAVSPQNDQEILDAVEAYLSVKSPAKWIILDGVPEGLPAYLTEPRENYWVVSRPATANPISCGSSRYLFVSKKTGKVVSDQNFGE